MSDQPLVITPMVGSLVVEMDTPILDGSGLWTSDSNAQDYLVKRATTVAEILADAGFLVRRIEVVNNREARDCGSDGDE